MIKIECPICKLVMTEHGFYFDCPTSGTETDNSHFTIWIHDPKLTNKIPHIKMVIFRTNRYDVFFSKDGTDIYDWETERIVFKTDIVLNISKFKNEELIKKFITLI